MWRNKSFFQKKFKFPQNSKFFETRPYKKNYKGGLFNPVFYEMNFGICLKMRKKFNFFQKNCYNSKTIKGMNLKF